MSAPSGIQSVELLVLSNNPSRQKAGAGWKLRLVQYYKDGKNVSVKLESGEYFIGEDGTTRFKAKGLTLRDLDELKKIDIKTKETVWNVVYGLMKNPPAPPTEEQKPEGAKEADPDSVPFS